MPIAIAASVASVFMHRLAFPSMPGMCNARAVNIPHFFATPPQVMHARKLVKLVRAVKPFEPRRRSMAGMIRPLSEPAKPQHVKSAMQYSWPNKEEVIQYYWIKCKTERAPLTQRVVENGHIGNILLDPHLICRSTEQYQQNGAHVILAQIYQYHLDYSRLQNMQSHTRATLIVDSGRCGRADDIQHTAHQVNTYSSRA